MTRSLRLLLLLLVALGMSSSLGACDAPADTSVDPIGDDGSGFTDGSTVGDDEDQAPTTASVETIGDGSGIAHPEVELPPPSRSMKRLTVDMLTDSQSVVAGEDADGTPIRWTVKVGPQEYDALHPSVLGGTLGKPDWKEVTEEGAVPTALYSKFMDDMARDVCEKMATADLQRTDASERTLIRESGLDETADGVGADDSALRANARYLLLRFLAQRVDTDDQAVTDLVDLFHAGADAATAGQPAAEGWFTVCVALMTSPAFHLY